MTDVLGVHQELWEFDSNLDDARVDAAVRKRVVTFYRQRIVMPRARVREIAWFSKALAELNILGFVNYAELVPLRQPWKPSMQWAPWGPCLWRFFRAWSVCRITGGVPLAVWGVGGVELLIAKRPLCGGMLVGLRHILQDCLQVASDKFKLPLEARDVEAEWVLTGVGDVGLLRKKCAMRGSARRA